MLLPKSVSIVAVLIAVLCLSGCEKPPGGASSAVTDTNREIYAVKGVLKELKPDGKTAVIAHERIPDYMEPMVMDFEVKEKRELAGLRAGDYLSFRLIVTTNDAWIDQVQKLAPPNTNRQPDKITLPAGEGTNAKPATFRKSPVVEALEVGQKVPDYKFTNHLDQPVNLGAMKGRAFALTFIFTRCPLPTFCPRMSGNFATAQQKLLERAGAPTNWMLFSVSFDPEFDTPARLARYAGSYAVNTNHWQFLVSDFWNIDGITEQLGVVFYKDQGSINHNLRTAVFDTQGRLQRVFVSNDWNVDEFVDEVIKAARAQ